MSEFLSRLLSPFRRRQPAPEPEAPRETYLEALEREIEQLRVACIEHAGQPLERPLREALATARMEHQYRSIPRILPAPQERAA